MASDDSLADTTEPRPDPQAKGPRGDADSAASSSSSESGPPAPGSSKAASGWSQAPWVDFVIETVERVRPTIREEFEEVLLYWAGHLEPTDREEYATVLEIANEGMKLVQLSRAAESRIDSLTNENMMLLWAMDQRDKLGRKLARALATPETVQPELGQQLLGCQAAVSELIQRMTNIWGKLNTKPLDEKSRVWLSGLCLAFQTLEPRFTTPIFRLVGHGSSITSEHGSSTQRRELRELIHGFMNRLCERDPSEEQEFEVLSEMIEKEVERIEKRVERSYQKPRREIESVIEKLMEGMESRRAARRAASSDSGAADEPASKRTRGSRAANLVEPRLGRIDSGLRPFLEPENKTDGEDEHDLDSDSAADSDSDSDDDSNKGGSTKTLIDYMEVDLLAEFGMSRLFHSR